MQIVMTQNGELQTYLCSYLLHLNKKVSQTAIRKRCVALNSLLHMFTVIYTIMQNQQYEIIVFWLRIFILRNSGKYLSNAMFFPSVTINKTY